MAINLEQLGQGLSDEEFENQIVTDEGETIAVLRKVFDRVCNEKHWKGPWLAKVPHQLVGTVIRATEFFHADKPQVLGIEQLTGLVIMSGKGYQAY